MRIARDGTWFYQGSPIGRRELVRLFASVLHREADGYWLITPAEKARIAVDDAPFTAVAVEVEGLGRNRTLIFTTNVEDRVTLGPAHPLRVTVDAASGEPRPYILVRPGLEALILRSVYYELVELGEDESDGFGIWSGGGFFRLDGG